MDAAVRERVRERAGNRCEYCRLRQKHTPFVLQIEHIVARKHGGGDELSNLALACDRYNLHKGSDLTGIDPGTNQIVELFNPRAASWHEHFILQEVEIVGRSACGRATVRVLQMNAARRVRVRAALLNRGELDVGD
jgi:hypothetical protein